MAEIHNIRAFETTTPRNRGLHLLDEFARQGRTAFTTSDVREALGLSPQATSNLLTRLVTSGFVDRVGGGRYVIRPIGSLGTVAAWDDLGSATAAAFAGHPHRISFLTALDHQGLLIRPVRPVQVASPYRPRLTTLSGRPLRVVHEVEVTVLEGTEPLGPSRVATVPRALLDTASRPQLVGGASRLTEALTAVHAVGGLHELATQLHMGSAYRRIGSIAAMLELPIAGNLSPPAWRSVVELDPTADRRHGWIDSVWGVAWPYPSSELEDIARQ